MCQYMLFFNVGLSLLPDSAHFLQVSQEQLNRRQRNNAKAVQWLDLEGNLLGTFRSVSIIEV